MHASDCLEMNLDSWKTVCTYGENILSELDFWSAVEVWNRKPDLINKRISGVLVVEKGNHSKECIKDLLQDLKEIDFTNIDQYREYKSTILKSVENMKFKAPAQCCDPKIGDSYALFVKFLCPKSTTFRLDLLELTLYDAHRAMVVFLKPIKEETKNSVGLCINYGIKLESNSFQLVVPESVDESHENVKWLTSNLLPNLARWAKIKLKKPPIRSLRLLPIDEFCFLYNHLKAKHSKYIQEIWTEKTNPQKFIFEDIGIAAYLILLWKKEKRFVDLGCGNGLLVHILNTENHSGVGIDVRPRKIWDKYPSTTVLKVATIIPSESSLFPDADWLIGNHSDELTPWIPVIAARSSYNCNFFLLPCCAYEFNGQKYARTNTSQSTYENYMLYLEGLCKTCGFEIETDRLKIPSTKRQCIVSRGRIYREGESDVYDKAITECIGSQKADTDDSDQKSWVDNFKPRSSKEAVRNCTQLETELIKTIVDLTVNKLLENRAMNREEWDKGTETSICDVVDCIPKHLLERLRKEHGGLQTLLRNNHQIFLVKNGTVLFRKPQLRANGYLGAWKKKQCWFYHNHPDSCPLVSEHCSFIH